MSPDELTIYISDELQNLNDYVIALQQEADGLRHSNADLRQQKDALALHGNTISPL